MSDAVQRVSIGEALQHAAFRPRMHASAAASAAPVVEIDAFARGFDEGQRAATAIFDGELAALRKCLAAAEAMQPEASDELAALIAMTVDHLVGQIVGEAAIDRDTLAARARGAAEIIAATDGARTIRVSPEDMELLEGVELPLALLADPALERGDIRIDCSGGWIEDGNALYLDALRAELGLPEPRA